MEFSILFFSPFPNTKQKKNNYCNNKRLVSHHFVVDLSRLNDLPYGRGVGSSAWALRYLQTGSFGYRWTLTDVQVLIPLYTDHPILLSSPISSDVIPQDLQVEEYGIFWKGKTRCNVQKQALAVVNSLWTRFTNCMTSHNCDTEIPTRTSVIEHVTFWKVFICP